MDYVPLKSVPAQKLGILLAEQNCQIGLYQKSNGMYLDLFLDNKPIATSVLCRDRIRLIRREYSRFEGDLMFFDTQGKHDPDYTGLGGRFLLVYLPISAV
ncbi:MAG: hypothetical protein LBK01_06920 [Burkholderiaceae bacterium]|jgi:hypothetical protein|nr:hypothetical protein [Burkholderiaceae bacterium]